MNDESFEINQIDLKLKLTLGRTEARTPNNYELADDQSLTRDSSNIFALLKYLSKRGNLLKFHQQRQSVIKECFSAERDTNLLYLLYHTCSDFYGRLVYRNMKYK